MKSTQVYGIFTPVAHNWISLMKYPSISAYFSSVWRNFCIFSIWHDSVINCPLFNTSFKLCKVPNKDFLDFDNDISWRWLMKEFNTVLVNFLGIYDLNGVKIDFLGQWRTNPSKKYGLKTWSNFQTFFVQSSDTNRNRIAWFAEQKNPVKSHNF